jgi:lysophospholipid acyltransferase (LPLAT)-like uncharacterized protein
MAAGQPAGFTLDGPRGPARIAQPGALWLAKITGNPVVPFHLEADRHWTLNSWDRTQIPKPFSTVAVAMGSAIDIPPEADASDIERARKDVEASLADLEQRAMNMLHSRVGNGT